MDFSELKNKSEKELKEILQENRSDLRELKFKVSENQLKNLAEIKKVKKNISRILTILTSKKDKIN